ncbi:MAG: hypothetical protein ACOC0E_06265 [Spirochaetota bacterium]
MLEIIEEVLEAEAQASRIVGDAKQEAARTRAEFSEIESRTLRDAHAAADARVREELAALRDEQDGRVARAEARLREDAREFAPERDPRIAAAVRRSVDLITGGR